MAKMKSDAEIALEVTLEMVVEMCDKDADLAKYGPKGFIRVMRDLAQKGLDDAKKFRKSCQGGCTSGKAD